MWRPLAWLLLACTCINVTADWLDGASEHYNRRYLSTDVDCSGTEQPQAEVKVIYLLEGQSCNTVLLGQGEGGGNLSGVIGCDSNDIVQFSLHASTNAMGGTGPADGDCTGAPLQAVTSLGITFEAYISGCYLEGTGVNHLSLSPALPESWALTLCDQGCTGSICNFTTITSTTSTTSTTTTTTTTTGNNQNSFSYNGQTYSYGNIFTFQGTADSDGGDYYFYGVSTLLTGQVNPGGTTLPVGSQVGFNVGDTVLIGGYELRKIVSFSSIHLATGVSGTHGSGTSVVAVVSASGSVGGDPVAIFGDVRREFWLPPGRLHPILRMPELNMFASTFHGDWGEQWFDRIVITSPGGFKIADISINKNIASFNKTASPKNSFETLDVALGATDVLMDHMPEPDFVFNRMGVYITFMRMDQMRRPIANQMRIQRARRDVVMVACKSAHLVVAASPASEYSSFRPDLAVRYAHIDIVVLEMHRRHMLKGLLPELWGIQPMSNQTKSFLVPPKTEAADNLEATHMPEEGTKSASETRFLVSRTDRNSGNQSVGDLEEDGKDGKEVANSTELKCRADDSTNKMPCVL